MTANPTHLADRPDLALDTTNGSNRLASRRQTPEAQGPNTISSCLFRCGHWHRVLNVEAHGGRSVVERGRVERTAVHNSQVCGGPESADRVERGSCQNQGRNDDAGLVL